MKESFRTKSELLTDLSLLMQQNRELAESAAYHRRLADELRESVIYARSLFASSCVPLVVMDARTGSFTDCNDAAVRIYGYATREEVLGKTPLDVSAPLQYDGAASAAAATNHIQAGCEKGSHMFEWRHQRPDGQVWDANVHLMLLPCGGKPLIQFMLEDITERRQTERLLSKGEAILRGVFRAAPVGLSITKDRVFQSVNKAFLENLGYPESDLLGRTTRLLYEDDQEYERVGRELAAGFSDDQLTHIATRLRRKDGFMRDVHLTVAFLRAEDVAPGMAVVTIEDVTDRKRAEEVLKENRKQLANIIEFLPDATLVIDKEGKVMAWNQAIEALTGVKKEDMIGRGNHEYALPFYGDRRNILVDYAFNSDSDIQKNYTIIQRRGDILIGDPFTANLLPGNVHLSGTASVLRDEQGAVYGAIECIRDNTEHKKLEERLQRAEKMEALGQLAGGVAHDLNNVLGGLVGYSELLRDELPAGSHLKRYAENILKSGIRGAAIINDLLTLARRGVTNTEILDLNKLIGSYLDSPELEELKAHHPGVQILTSLEDRLLNIKASPFHLEKTIMNLVANALEAISGAGEVRITTQNCHLDRPVRRYEEMPGGDYVVLKVSDTGAGIPGSDRDRIFEPFYTRKVMGRSGTGLGLAVVWGTVKDLHGYIDVQSEEGRGSTIVLYLPVARGETSAMVRNIEPAAYRGRNESLLVVDDVQEQRELALDMLGKLGYQVDTAASGEEAVEYVKNKRPDLIILDMIMEPGIDGTETYRRILEINPRQKAIFVSGFSETDRFVKARAMGAGSFVPKPYIREKIGLAVRRELDGP